MSQQRDATAKGCQSKGMSQQRDVTAKGCHSKGMSQRDVTSKGCQIKGMSKQRDVTAKGCQGKGMKTAFSHLPLSDFEGNLARKLRCHIFHFHFLREVLHEMRFES